MFDLFKKQTDGSDAMAQARANLTQMGLTVSDEAFASLCENPFLPTNPDVEELTGMMVGFMALGSENDDGSRKPLSSQVYAFDAEVFDLEEMYTIFLEDIAHLFPELTITEIAEDLSGMTEEMDFDGPVPTDGTRAVSFVCNGRPYRFEMESRGDWFNPDFFDRFETVLAAEDLAGQLHGCAFDGQMVLCVRGDEAWAREICRLVSGDLELE